MSLSIGMLPESLLDKYRFFESKTDNPVAAAILTLAEVQAMQQLPGPMREEALGLAEEMRDYYADGSIDHKYEDDDDIDDADFDVEDDVIDALEESDAEDDGTPD